MALGSLTNASFGPYVLRELVGAGGIAEVYRAQHREDGASQLAVKVMRIDRHLDNHHVKSFKAEFELLSRLSYDGVPKALRIGEINGRLAIAMQYFSGKPLHVLKGSIESLDVEAIFLRFTEIVGYLHSQRIVHNDLKLENVILQEDSSIGLVDFGNAREISLGLLGKLFRKKERVFATPSYVAPEVIAGEAPNFRSDLYAIGVCCFMLLTGDAPFDNTRKSDRLRATMTSKAPSIGERSPGLTQAFVRLIDSCLVKDPEQRPRDAGQLHAQLQAISKSRTGTGIYSRAREAVRKAPDLP
jgi:serine/threonine protein kinase